MLNSKQMKLATKAIETIAKFDRPITFALNGVIQSIKANEYPAHEMLIPLWGQDGTVGAITAKENWDTDPAILDHMIASVQGRMAHFHVIDNVGVNVTLASPEQIAELMTITDAQQERVLKSIVGEEAYKAYKVEQAAALAQYEVDATKPTVH